MRVAIVGAGIGGLTAAAYLLRDRHEVVCYERVASLREVGAGLQMAPNGSRLLHRLGLRDALERVAVRPVMDEYRSTDGTVQATESLVGYEQRYGAPLYTIHRADLHDMLRSLIPASAIKLSTEFVGLDQSADAVTLRFADGSSAEADVVIGADGIRSRVRTLVSDDAPRFGGKYTFRCLCPIEKAGPPPPGGPKIVVTYAPTRSAVLYPISAGRFMNVAGVVPSSLELAESWTNVGRVEDILAAFEGWHEDLLRPIAAAERVLIRPLYDREPIERWGEGRFTLLGDAAHPMFPYAAQGAVQAIEDACVLALSLRGVDREAAADALRAYEKSRHERTAWLQRASAEVNETHDQVTAQIEGAGDGEAAQLEQKEDPEQRLLFGFDVETGEMWKPPAKG